MRSLICLAAVAGPAAAMAQPAPAPGDAKPPCAQVGEVVVTGRAAEMQTSIDRRSYSLANDLQAQSGSVADALRNLPSVQVDMAGNVSLRGDPNVTILVDGKPSSQFEGDGKGQALQALSASQIERVEVITNPSAEFRADGSGGVINLISRKARGVGPTASARLTLANHGRAFASANFGYNGPALSVTGDLNVRHDNLRFLNRDDRQRFDAAGADLGSLVQSQDLHSTLDMDTVRLAADHALDGRTKLGGEIRAYYYDFTIGGPGLYVTTAPAGGASSTFRRDLDLHQIRDSGAAEAHLTHSFAKPGREFTLNVSYEATEDDRNRDGRTVSLTPAAPDAYDRQELRYDYRRTEAKGDYVDPGVAGGTLKAGFDIQADDNSYRNAGFRGAARGALVPDATLSNVFLFEQSLVQGYVSYERAFGDLSLQAGLRVERVRIDLDQLTEGRHDDNDHDGVYPSLHLAWRVGEGRKLTASYAERVQRPNPLQFNSFPLLLDPVNLRAGNPGLKPQETRSFEIGYEDRTTPATLLATLYYRETHNGVADVVSDLGNGLFLTAPQNVAESRAAGLELVLSGRLTKTLTYNASGGLGWSEMGPQPLGAPRTRTQTAVSGRANVSWQATPDDLLQLNAVLNGRQLTPQGYIKPTAGLNLGYRHKIDDRLALVVTVRDALHSFKVRQVLDTPTLQGRIRSDADTRQVQVGLTWTFGGGGRPREPGFDFGSGPAGPPT